MKKTLAVALVAIALVAACGGGGPSQPSGSTKVTILTFDEAVRLPSTISAPSGKVVFFHVNGGSVAHDLVIRDSSGNRKAGSELISAGDSSVFTVDSIAAGTYTIFCDQAGHESSGMKGTLTIT